VNRTVLLSDKEVEPPGEARSDLDIFLDYSRRMDFRTRSGRPLLEWTGPEDGFEAWKECSRGRLVDYTGLSYEKLRGGSGIPWPCNDEHPDGTARLYGDAVFPTDYDRCETFGHDLLTGATVGALKYRAQQVNGRAILKPAAYTPSHEPPDEEYPFHYTTGRTVYQFHTRTKTGRTPQLNKAAPAAWAEISKEDAQRLGIREGDLIRVASRRGEIVVPARVGGVRPGTVFAPFHYGYWEPDRTGPKPREGAGSVDQPTEANELTMSEWDPVSKQPILKNAAVLVEKVADGVGPAPAPTTAASRPVDPSGVPATVGGPSAEASEEIRPAEESAPAEGER
jgi:anaerobic selenocysteine-containing dehydrogenase